MPWNSKKYNRINWKNRPSTATALGATNLNKMDVFLNDVDDYLITLDAGKLDVATANGMLKTLEIDVKTGKIKATELGGATHEWDLNVEKIPVSFSLHSDGTLVMTTDDGTEFEANIADAIRDYEFEDTDTIAFTKTYDEPGEEGNYNNKGTYTIKANLRPGSITGDLLDPDWRADVQQFKNEAEAAAKDALTYSKDAKRYTVGDAEFPGSEEDNAKYYYERTKESQAAALASEQNAEGHASAAAISEQNAADSQAAAELSAQAAATSEANAEASKNSADESAESAGASAQAASKSQTAAADSAATAEQSATNAEASQAEAEKWQKLSESFAHGKTGGTRENEDSDNAEYYYEQAKRISQGLEGSLLPMGTIEFSALATSTKQAGYMYNITDAFTSTADFKDGGGKYYGAGANVYWTADGAWDVLAPVVVSGVKGGAENDYRVGNVSLSAENVGAVPVTRKVNNKPLSADVTLAAADVGALPITGGTVTGQTVFSHSGDADGTTAGSPALIVGGQPTGAHIAIDNNEIIAKSNATTSTQLNLNTNGGKVYVGSGGLTVAGAITGNLTGNASSASTAAKLTTQHTIFGKAFNGTQDVAGQALVYGTYQSAANTRYNYGGIQVRENGMVGSAQSDIGYAPTIGFHWAGRAAGTLALDTGAILHYLNQSGGRGTIDANLNGNAATATTASACSGNAATATKLATARALQVNLASANSQNFDGSAAATSIGTTGILPVARGGTGNSTGYVRAGQKSGTNIGSYATAEGFSTTASGNYSHAEGYNTTASGIYSHAEGANNTASSAYAHAEGNYTTASSTAAHAEGSDCVARGNYSHAEGYDTIASGESQHAQGEYNVEKSIIDALFIIGNGTDSRSNAFRVTRAGATYAKSNYNASGADYAEYFEWEDGNPQEEERQGYFVSLNGDKIRKANPSDEYILGVVSANPSVVGNSPDEWHGRFLMDEWGRFVMKKYTLERRNGETVEEDGYVLSPDFDEEKGDYVARENRPEWAAVGMLGVLRVRDMGDCQVDGYCTVGDDGIAVPSDHGWRVIDRVNEHIVKVVFR